MTNGRFDIGSVDSKFNDAQAQRIANHEVIEDLLFAVDDDLVALAAA